MRSRETDDENMAEAEKPQVEKFKEAARDLECDDNNQSFQERLAFIAKQKPKPDKPDA